MKRILVPCDFSAPAQEAFKFAVAIAHQSNGEIHVLYVMDIPFLKDNPLLSYGNAIDPAFLNEIEKKVRDKFELMRSKHAPPTMDIKFKIDISTLVLDIEKTIHDRKIDLVIIGANSSSHSLWGSNSMKIVRHAEVPVITVRKNPTKKIETIIFPVVPTQSNKELEKELMKMQDFFNANIHLLWVNTPLIFKTDEEAMRQLQHYAHTAKFQNYSLNICADYTIETGILRFAREKKADMIALGTHSWKGVAHLLTGSIAEDVVNHANLPIWTYTLDRKNKM